jgi:hypothetical protein
MFDSPRRLEEQIAGLLETIRAVADGRYACIMEPGTIHFESPEPEGNEIMTLRRLLDLGAARIFTLPEQMADDLGPGPESDPFEGWDHDELLLAFVNGRVAVVVACPDAEAARGAILDPLRALVDRLLRWKGAYRLDARGRGLLFGRPKLDFVTIGHHPGASSPPV